jgi:hypothetical protein
MAAVCNALAKVAKIGKKDLHSYVCRKESSVEKRFTVTEGSVEVTGAAREAAAAAREAVSARARSPAG